METERQLVRATVGVLLVDVQGRVLLVHRPRPPFAEHWIVPGGHIDQGETAEQAAIRETREETGLLLSNLRYLGYYDELFPELSWYAVSQHFTGEWQGALSPQSGEGTAKWFTIEEALRLPLAFLCGRLLREKYTLATSQ